MIPCFRKMSKHAVRRLHVVETCSQEIADCQNRNKQFHHLSRLTTQPQKAYTALKCSLANCGKSSNFGPIRTDSRTCLA